MARAWQGQIWLALADIKPRHWVLNIPRSLGYFLPWLFFLPLARRAEFSDARKATIVHGLIWGIAVPLVIVDLIPGSLPRYAMPLVAPAAWLLAAIFTADKLEWPKWLGGKSFSKQDRRPAVTAIVIITCIGVWIYALAIVPQLQKKQKIKAIAAEINARIPASQPLYAVDPDYQPFLFYVERPVVYVSKVADVPHQARYFLIRPSNEEAARTAQQWLPSVPQPVLRIKDYRRWKTILFEVESSESSAH